MEEIRPGLPIADARGHFNCRGLFNPFESGSAGRR
jgi:hypothetical protein